MAVAARGCGGVLGTLALALIVLTSPAAVSATDPPAQQPEPRPTNRLADSASPYLLLHAHNPVHWYPWGTEAFARARVEDKPIFLSVGYSTCFWCHVAERTLYSDPAIAALMNRWFVNVKVDREQRPDVDRAYMLARQIISGTGGWPNNVFLTPDLKPFYAGSYFPPERDEHGRPGFPQVLQAIHRAWTARRTEVMANVERVQAALGKTTGARGGADLTVTVDPDGWTSAAILSLLRRFDTLQGGFSGRGSPTKFPQAPILQLLLIEHRQSKDDTVAEALTETLDAIAYGGIQDHLAGGFHRYSTDPDWSVPHFEKMLYDNAQLLRIYAQAHAQFGKPLYADTARRIGHYLITRMMAPGGGFYTAEDAQVDGVEGASYVWTAGEIAQVLGDEKARSFLEVYSLEPVPHSPAAVRAAAAPIPEGAAVLRVRLPVDEALEKTGHDTVTSMLDALAPERAALLARRDRRKAPLRDEKLSVDLNGLAIDGFAIAGRALGEPRYVEVARRAAEQMWMVAHDERSGTLFHQVFKGKPSGDAFLADYAHLARALLTLHAVTGDIVWRERARRLADAMLDEFMDADGRLTLSRAAGELPVQLMDNGDLESPSGTSTAVHVLMALASMEGGGRYAGAASRILRRQAAGIARHPDAWPAMLTALQAPTAAPVISAANDTGHGMTTAVVGGTETPPLPVTSDFVQVRSKRDPVASTVIITLAIHAGYHINANPATLDFLIPTRVDFDGAAPVELTYPAAKRFRPSFTDTVLDVYEGDVAIVASFEGNALAHPGGVAATVTAQACNDTVCLPPSRIEVPLND